VLNDQIVFLHPCKGVKVPPKPSKPLTIVTPEQFDAIHQALPDAMSRLLVETDIESGLRWGELAELRVGDLMFLTAKRPSAGSCAPLLSGGSG
jgi:integrase